MKNTNYNMKGVRIALADWHKLKDALTAFIRANYTNYSFDDTIKKVGEYLALEEYIYGRTYYMCSTYAWCNDRLFTTKDEAAFKAATDPMAWMQNHIERLSERDENLERDLQREASIDKYRAERVAYYEKAKEPEIEKYKSFIESLPKGKNKCVRLTVEIDGKQFTGGYEAESIRYCCPHRPDAFIHSNGFRYPDENDRFCEFMNEIGHINSEPIPFSNVTEIAAFQGSKVFWKKEA